MSYYWKDIIKSALAKLDLDQSDQEVNAQNFKNRFYIYANEVITQVCSAIKPKRTFAEFVIDKDHTDEVQTMPTDFVSFGIDRCFQLVNGCEVELHMDDFRYHGYNQVIFKHPGKFYISYNARWYTFSEQERTEEGEVLPIPDDIVECIASYIASQCYKVDDEYKASVFRNEYEMFLSRIDDTHYETNTTMFIEGDW